MADFEETPTAFADAIAELVGWSGQYLHLEVSVAGGAGVSAFDAHLESVEAGAEKGTVLFWFQGDIALVVLSDVMSVSAISSPTMKVRWLRFEVGEHQSIEVERLEPEEIWRRIGEAGANG